MTTFTLPDPYEGWSSEQLKQRCRELCRASMHRDMVILSMLDKIPGGVDAIPEQFRDEVRRLRDAYED
jgi:hypothetical protein